MPKKISVFKKIQILWDLCKGYHKNFVFVFFMSMISGLFISVGISTISPILDLLLKNDQPDTSTFLGRISNILLNLFPENTARYLIVIFIIFITIMGIAVVITNWRKFHLLNTIANSWREKIFHNYLKSNFAFFMAQKQGTLYHNSLGETKASAQTLRYILDLGIGVINACCYIVFLALISWQLTLLLLGIGLIFAYLPLRIVNKKAKGFGRKRIKINQAMSQNCSQALSGFRQILLYNQVEEEMESFSKKSRLAAALTTKTAVMQSTPNAVRDFAIFFMVGIGIGFIQFVDLNINRYLPLLATYGLIAMKFFPIVSTIISNFIALSEKSPSIKLINSLINDHSNLRKNDTKGILFTDLKEDIEIRNVDFAYKNGNRVFSQLNLTIPKGKMTALIGPSGIGKSTLVDLLVGLYDDYQGEILVNGKELKEYSRQSIWNKISYVSQDPFIFNRTIRENITLNQAEISEEELIGAIRIAGCEDFLNQLDNGLDTVIGERGTRLSGGQRQRVSIARAVLRKPDIYIFDEATSALDNETEKFIQNSIEEISKSSTVIVIAHRLSTIENADVVYDLGKL